MQSGCPERQGFARNVNGERLCNQNLLKVLKTANRQTNKQTES